MQDSRACCTMWEFEFSNRSYGADQICFAMRAVPKGKIKDNRIPCASIGSCNSETSDMLSLVFTMSGSTLMKGDMPTGGLGAPALLFARFATRSCSAASSVSQNAHMQVQDNCP